jgi:altronate dehydratase
MSAARALVLSPSDNVAVALVWVSAGADVQIGGLSLQAAEAIPQGHKVALTDIDEHAPVIKYGSEIGRATQPIARGSHVHVHNLESARLRGDR